jgi:GTPase SAR1 family protein
MSVTIQLALISHTNNGKTTLARTLTGIDVGEVRDAAHVTVRAEVHTLLTTAQGDLLQLWDTPGFGDSVRLQKRLAQASNPIGWFLREVLDRYRDRPFWLSQQALRAARDTADIVLYLVNSSEDPQDAGYLPAEMKILEWLGKPVVVLLNQSGKPRPLAQELAEQTRWRDHLRQYAAVRDVLSLDAFSRSWVHERLFYAALSRLVSTDQQAAYAGLLAVWEARNAQRYEQAMQLLATHLLAAAHDSEAMPEQSSGMLKSALKMAGVGKSAAQQRQEQAMAQLVARLNQRTTDMTRELLVLHQLDPANAAEISAQVREHFALRAPIDKAQAGLLGAMISGAATGLSADLLAGGLTLGGGALLGGLAGALTFAGAAWGFNASTERNQATMQFTDAFMQTLVVAGILRYLAVAHFGRGRGSFVDGEAPAFWQSAVEQVVAQQDAALSALWKQARREPAAAALQALLPLVEQMVSATLAQLTAGSAPR